MHAKEAMEDREPVMPSKHFIKTFFESFAEDPIFNSVYKEKEGDVDEAEHPPEKNTANKYGIQYILLCRGGICITLLPLFTLLGIICVGPMI